MIARIAAATIAVLLGLATALAQETPDLTGTWTGTFKAQMPANVTTGTFTMVIDHQDGELFRGHKDVVRDDDSDTLVSANEELVRNPSERFLGVISADGQSFHLAELGDPGWYAGRIIDGDSFEVTYVESGPVPTVHRTLLKRQK
ncbi:MAG: hypothetical protein GY798_13980 [Hyphomicrobiales bacterium]|nr:hypothetical protein [Hyphomicrobiales bacterium]